MTPKPCWAMGPSTFWSTPVRLDQAYFYDLALADPDDQAIGDINQGLGVRDGLSRRADIEPSLLDEPAGARGARLQLQFLKEDRRGDAAFGIELIGGQGYFGNLIGIKAGGSSTEVGRRQIRSLCSVVLRDDGFAKSFFRVP